MHEGRALISFDLSSIPTNATIESASLSLHYSGLKGAYSSSKTTFDTKGSFTIHKMTASWEEANATKWNTHNTSYNSTAEDTYEYTPGSVEWADFDVTAAIGEMVQSSSNNGFMIITHSPAADNATNGWGGLWTFWASSDTSDISVRPKLTITYDEQVGVSHVSDTKGAFSVGGAVIGNRLLLSLNKATVATVELVTLHGRWVTSFDKQLFQSGVNSLTLPSSLGNGVYLLKVVADDDMFVQSIIVTE